MAKLLLFLFLTVATAAGGRADTMVQGDTPEKLTHLKFYFHDVLSGRNPTAVRVVQAPSSSTTSFGMLTMIDDALTVGPELNSTLVGRAQGFYASASQEEVALLMSMSFAFVEDTYSGSTLTVLGRNPVLSAVREMPVVGGSGMFRYARGYVQARTYSLDVNSGDAIVEYNVFVQQGSAGSTGDPTTSSSSTMRRYSIIDSTLLVLVLCLWGLIQRIP